MIVLDTHVLLWMVDAPKRLSEAALGALGLEEEVAVSTVSAQEIAYLEQRGKIRLDRPVGDWIRDALQEHEIESIAPDLNVAIRAGLLDADDFPGDPADRTIYATAVQRGARLVSADRRLRELDPARVVW